MSSAEGFYPGFEHAGLETGLDRALTWSLCIAVFVADGVAEFVRDITSRLAPAPIPAFDA